MYLSESSPFSRWALDSGVGEGQYPIRRLGGTGNRCRSSGKGGHSRSPVGYRNRVVRTYVSWSGYAEGCETVGVGAVINQILLLALCNICQVRLRRCAAILNDGVLVRRIGDRRQNTYHRNGDH